MTDKSKTASQKPDPRKGRAGRKKITISPEQIEDVKRYAAQGLRERDIAALLGMAQEAFINRKKEMPELVEALRQGKAMGVELCTRKLYENVNNNDTTAIKYWLNNRTDGRWRDKVDHTVAGDPTKPIGVIAMGANLDDQQAKQMYAKFMQGDEE